MESNWNTRYLRYIEEEKKEAESYYGIRINKTDISCSYCNRPWSFFHICSGTPPERKDEIQRIQSQLNRPISLLSIEDWRKELGIELGMSNEEALEKFRGWREKKKTCERCIEKEYEEYCPIRLICKEGDNEQSKYKPINFGEKLSRSSGNVKIDSLRIAPKRVSLAKSRG